ncbi:MerR family transcriptional regulator [Candidatus Nanopelagicales bacterium]|nr:MerR family transcriptional regulator [Candidatus Nanopelagicales bacterium]
MNATAQRSAGLTIGMVLTMLQSEFESISISKIRFLESKGLVVPQRARSGYRLFSNEDVERLRLILTVQRDAYLPLKVIADKLADGSLPDILNADEHPEPAPRLRSVKVAEADSDEAAQLPMDQLPEASLTESELQCRTGLDVAVLRGIVKAGLVELDRFGKYPPQAVPICQSVQVLTAHGIDPRHLTTLRVTASRESGHVEQAAAHKVAPDERQALINDLIAAYSSLHHWVLDAATKKS